MRAFLLASVAMVRTVAFMSEICETVIVKGVRMNKSDYDANPEKFGAIDDKETDAQTDSDTVASPLTATEGVPIPPAPSAPNFGNPVAPQTPSIDTISLIKEGTGAKTKYFAVRSDGTKITDMKDIDAAGYPDEGVAWAAIMAAKKQPHEQNVQPPAGMPPAGDGPTT